MVVFKFEMVQKNKTHIHTYMHVHMYICIYVQRDKINMHNIVEFER